MMLLLLIGLSLSVMGFGPRLMEEETVEEEAIVEEEEEKPCTVNDHYKVYLAIDEVYVLDDIGYRVMMNRLRRWRPIGSAATRWAKRSCVRIATPMRSK